MGERRCGRVVEAQPPEALRGGHGQSQSEQTGDEKHRREHREAARGRGPVQRSHRGLDGW